MIFTTILLLQYRPICLSSTISKTMQRMVIERLSYIIEKLYLPNNQYGFRKQRSTNDCILIFENAILETFSILKKLLFEHGGMESWFHYNLAFVNMLILNFLNNRSFRVILQNTKSAIFHQMNGVPQGETLSAYLSLISINSVYIFLSNKVAFLLYADYLTLFVHAKILKTCQKHLQNPLNKLTKWCVSSGISFSPSKTKAIHFTKLPQIYWHYTMKYKSRTYRIC